MNAKNQPRLTTAIGVIHGDIKPANILVQSGDDPNNVQIKVADFGFSSLESASDGDVMVARSPPWEAPEWHARSFSLEKAKAMDMYSLGLLCLWILFRDQAITELNGQDISLEDALFSSDDATKAKLHVLKRAGNSLLPSALRLVRESADVVDSDRPRLERLFTLTLCLDPNLRARSISELIILLLREPEVPSRSVKANCVT